MTTVTEVRIRKLWTEGSVKALLSITLNEDIAVHDVKIIQANNKLFVAMPNKKDEKTNCYRDIIHPITPDVRDRLEKQILEEYIRYVETINAESQD